jgi:TRAP transporter TAXI family solute receptor
MAELFGKREQLRRRRLWLLAGGLFVAMFFLSVWLVGPAPPRRIVMATGRPQGGYAFFGKKYKEKLDKMGLKVELVHTAGTFENYELLLARKADVAFVQGGSYPEANDTEGELRGLAALYLEPLWFFHRAELPIKSISDFKKRRIFIGTPHSGTEAIGRRLLKVHGIDDSNAHIEPMDMAAAGSKLKNGGLDVALIVSPTQNPFLLDLLTDNRFRLLSFERQAAYCRHFPFLTPVTLSEGVVDLERDIPDRDVPLVAPAALLICRQDLHPRAIEQVLNAAQSIHAPAGLVDGRHRFPSLQEVDVPVHEVAERYMRSGESFLSRLLPYWGVWLAYQVQVLILPVLVVWIPFLRILPAVYSFRINRLLRHHYVVLREVENAMEHTEDPARLREQLQILEHLRVEMASISRKVPGHLQRDVYHWRFHVMMVRNEALVRLKKLEEDKAAAPATPAPLAPSPATGATASSPDAQGILPAAAPADLQSARPTA